MNKSGAAKRLIKQDGSCVGICCKECPEEGENGECTSPLGYVDEPCIDSVNIAELYLYDKQAIIRITAHPVDREFQKELRIYASSIVQSKDVGITLKRLLCEGYTSIQVDTKHENEIRIHCKKENYNEIRH